MVINMRHQITEADIDRVMERIKNKWKFRLDQKGWGIFQSSHEISGIIDEEVREMKDDLRDNLCLENELVDIAVAAAHGVASIESEKMDW